MADLDRVVEVVERHHHVDPRPGRRQRHLELGYDPGGAEGSVDLLRLVATQLEDARRLLHGDDACGDDIARLAQPAIGDRSDSARSAGNEAADRRHPLGRRVHAQLPPVRPELGIDVDQLRAHLGPHQARLVPDDPRHRRHVEQHATLERHRLAIVSGRQAARRDRDAAARAGGHGRDDVGLAARHDDDIGCLAMQLGIEDRAVPEVVAATPPDRGCVGDDGNVAEIGDQPCDIVA